MENGLTRKIALCPCKDQAQQNITPDVMPGIWFEVFLIISDII